MTKIEQYTNGKAEIKMKKAWGRGDFSKDN